MNSQSNSIFHKDFRYQILSALCVNMMSLLHGICIGWFYTLTTIVIRSETQFIRNYHDIPLILLIFQPKTRIGLIIAVSSVIGSVLFACIMNMFGRKFAIFILAFPNLSFWLFVIFSSSIECFHIALFCVGLTFGGLLTVIPIYLIEISDIKIRGRLSVSFFVTIYLGFLLGYMMVMLIDYRQTALICLTSLIAYMVCIYYFLMESPSYFFENESYAEAEVAMEYFINYTDKTRDERIKFDLEAGELAKILKFERTQRPPFPVGYLSLDTCRLISLGIMIIAVNILTGTYGIFYYSYLLFNNGIRLYSSHLCILCVGLVQFVGALVVLLNIDSVERKFLLKLSLIGMYVGLSISGFIEYFTRYYFTYYYNVIFILVICFDIIFANIGILTVGFIVLYEMISNKIRILISVMFVSILSLSSWAIITYGPQLLYHFGVAGIFWILSFNCMIGLFMVHYALPETKHKPLLHW